MNSGVRQDSATTGISRADAIRLIRASGEEARDLFLAADRLRTRRSGARVTYSRKVFIPLTNLCRDRCGYCTFARQPGDGTAHTMTPEEVVAVAQAGKRRDAKRLCSAWATNRSYAIPSIEHG